MIHQVRIDKVLEVTAAVVREQDVDCFCRGVGFVGRHRVVDAVDDVGVRGEEGICLNLLERERN